jgi:hypothetical protein
VTITLAPAALADKPITSVRVGLLQSALPFPSDTRWQAGVSYHPIIGTVPVAANSTYYPCNEAFDVDLETTGVVSWEPWGIALGEQCLSGSIEEEEISARAFRRLEVQSEYLVSRTFWTGDVGTGTFTSLGAPNIPLASATADILTSTGPVGVVTAFSRVIQYLADTLGSQRGMIHIPPKLVPFVAFYAVALREGFQTLTAIADHILVLGAGYDGSSPNGEPDDDSSTWIYATSLVRAATSDIRTLTYFNRTNNMREARASRLAIAEWDLQAHGAAQVCIPDPGPSCEEVPS